MGETAYDELVVRCEAHLRAVTAARRDRQPQAAAAAGAPRDPRRAGRAQRRLRRAIGRGGPGSTGRSARAGDRRRHPQPEHLGLARRLRAREPRRRPRRCHRDGDARGPRLGRARTSSTSAAAAGSTSRASRRRRAPVVGVEPHPPLVVLARRRVAALPSVRVVQAPAASTTLPDASRRRGARAVGLLLRPGLRAGPGRAGPGDAPRRDGVRRRQRRDAVDVRGVVPAQPAALRPGGGGAVLGCARAGRGERLDIAWTFDSREDFARVVRIEFPATLADEILAGRPGSHRRRLRRQPLVAALLSTGPFDRNESGSRRRKRRIRLVRSCRTAPSARAGVWGRRWSAA